LLEKTFEKLLKNETDTLPKSLVSRVKKKLLTEKIMNKPNQNETSFFQTFLQTQIKKRVAFAIKT